ncbi:MAG: aspartate kinase [Pseudomonadales bacterium]|jgi:aspartate kinase|tara:strand:- start:24 stop:1262 length:1239 start_codon:yes stop_codon:yes gene_type:complete
MARFVMKFGGTSVANIELIERIADRVHRVREAGHEAVLVVSAMGHETDRLVALAESIDFQSLATRREMDVLLATGEQVTISLLAMMLLKKGISAKSYQGHQVGILTDDAHSRARVLSVETDQLLSDLSRNIVPVIAGFQGVAPNGWTTTLGRGGSDTTAVAVAAALNADECQIFTDVDGVYTTDPRVVAEARCMARITFEEMLEFASSGSKVLHTRAVEIANKNQVSLRVLSSFNDVEGTLITAEDNIMMEAPLISGIAFTRDEAKLTLRGVKDQPGIASSILAPISEANIEVDMIVQNIGADFSTDFTFTVTRADYELARSILMDVSERIGAQEVLGDERIAKLAIVGVGMRSHAGVAAKMFEILAKESINIQMISTSEIKISVVIDEKYLELAVRALHAGFGLEAEQSAH